jgi:hypothetical protein
MKKLPVLIIALVLISSGSLLAQVRTLKQVMELQMPKTAEDELCGTRGASVCWNPDTKKYYAAFCGNTGFPMAVFTPAGTRISKDSLTTMEDIRGMWYNPATKKLNANGYQNIGWISYELDGSGIPVSMNYIFTDMNQPNEQCVGAYDARLKYVLFLDKSRVLMYENFAGMFARVNDSVQIHWGRKKSQGPGEDEDALAGNENYNYSNVIATGVQTAELGFLNKEEKQIELYDIKEGYLQQILKLPENAPAEPAFNFAFSNGIFWLFDMENRKWIGYK